MNLIFTTYQIIWQIYVPQEKYLDLSRIVKIFLSRVKYWFSSILILKMPKPSWSDNNISEISLWFRKIFEFAQPSSVKILLYFSVTIMMEYSQQSVLMCSLNLYSLNILFLIIEHHFDDKIDVLQHKWFRCRNSILVELLQSLPKSLSCQVGFCNNVFLPKYRSCVKFMRAVYIFVIPAQVHQPM